MHPLRKQRLQLVILIVVAATVVVGLILYMLRENGNFFYTPAEIVAGEAPGDVYLRAGGMVVDGSLVRADDSLWVQFQITDGLETLTVEHTGILPDLFAEGEAAIASGNWMIIGFCRPHRSWPSTMKTTPRRRWPML